MCAQADDISLAVDLCHGLLFDYGRAAEASERIGAAPSESAAPSDTAHESPGGGEASVIEAARAIDPEGSTESTGSPQWLTPRMMIGGMVFGKIFTGLACWVRARRSFRPTVTDAKSV